MTILPVGDYRPDVPAYLGTHATVASNVHVRPDGSLGPLKAPVVAALGPVSQPTQAFVARRGDGVVYLYVGYASVIVRREGANFNTVLTVTNGNTTPLFPWRFAQFGNYVLAVNPVGGLYAQAIGATGDFSLVSGAPFAAHIAVWEPGFVALGYTNDGGNSLPNRLRWSGLDDHTSWPTLGTSAAAAVQSDNQVLPIGGAITAVLGAVGGAAGCVLTERAIYRVEYIGAPAVFAFREVGRGVGNVCVNGAIAVNGLAYFVSEQGFQVFDGQGTRAIGQGRVSATFWAEVDRENLHRVTVTFDPLRSVIVWAYPTTTATGGNPNKWLLYSYATDKWTDANDANVACALLFPYVKDYVPLDQIDTYFPSNPDNAGVVWDGATVNGGAPLLAGFDTSYQFVTYTGANLAARVETGEADSNGRRVYVSGIRPLTDAGTLTAQVGHRVSFADSVSYTTAQTRGVDYTAPARISTRYARARVNIPAGATWTYFQGADVTFRGEGKR